MLVTIVAGAETWLRKETSDGILRSQTLVQGWGFMKRKIAAIFAADIAGYSRLVAEDEEETLRRLASYRQVTDDFIAKCGGRIFNTAGDAVFAEFPSAVEAVRCAIDIQGSLRTRNMAYPASRQMSFRIGITIGDVVERDAGTCLHGGDAARGRQLLDAASQEADQGFGSSCARLDVAGGGHGGQPERDRRWWLSVFHQAGEYGSSPDAGRRAQPCESVAIVVAIVVAVPGAGTDKFSVSFANACAAARG